MLRLVVLSLLSVGTVRPAEHCPDSSCKFIPNDADFQQDVARRLSDYPDYTINPLLQTLLSKQLNMEFQAYYTYTSMAYYFDQDFVGLPGFHAMFKAASAEENGHAQRVLEYMNKRGAVPLLGDIKVPCNSDETFKDNRAGNVDQTTSHCKTLNMAFRRTSANNVDGQYLTACDWRDPLNAVVTARQMEINLLRQMRETHKAADAEGDVQLQDFLDDFMGEQTNSIKILSGVIAKLQRVRPCTGYYLVDQEVATLEF